MTTMTKPAPAKRSDIYSTDVQNLGIIPNFNEREDYGNIKELAQSILENGILNPLKCTKDPDNENKYLVIQGHRRLKACQLLIKEGKLTELRVPFLLEGRAVSEADRYIDMIAGNDGKSLTILEQANVIGKLLKIGLDEEEIAQRLCKPMVFVQNCELLLSAPVSIKKKVRENSLSPTLVFEMFRKEKSFDTLVKTIAELDSRLGSLGKKITKKDIDKKDNKVNSVVLFRKVVKKNPDMRIKPENKPLYDFVSRLINGEVSKEEMMETFFEKE